MRIDHIGIVVRDLDSAIRFYRMIGAEIGERTRLEEQGADIQVIILGTARIELLTPFKEGPISRFLEKHGEGMHHICIEVEDIEEMIERLKAGGFKMVDEEPRPGLEGLIAFIHPKLTHHVLYELKER
ncbi:methylmalonyl-CoA epimerase [candidate division WOR-3 bacterium]|uniref:Methylmalonyl-CoA epimerase n=1 Tax=candidate division WOR-3 bacterium TaxID=2052148 RepID=A0A660SLK5_UNCW3|nr:MAG: methylmalonyl-CoA epimerase [candidate division WOR-3 bacterium]